MVVSFLIAWRERNACITNAGMVASLSIPGYNELVEGYLLLSQRPDLPMVWLSDQGLFSALGLSLAGSRSRYSQARSCAKGARWKISNFYCWQVIFIECKNISAALSRVLHAEVAQAAPDSQRLR